MMYVVRDTGTQCLNGIYRNIRLQSDKIVLLTFFAFIWLFEEICECEPAWRRSKHPVCHNAQNAW